MVASDLESNGYFATEDLKEMMKIGSSQDVNIIVQTAGGSENSTIDDYRFIDFTKAQRYLILNNNMSLIQDLGERDMGDYRTVAEFLGWGVTNYPADKYVVIFWDDGAGLRGFGFDSLHKDFLTPGEIGDALARLGGVKFEVIGFDACLMASVEVASQVSYHGNYMIASEELEPGWGWDYTAIFKSLVENPKQDGKSLGMAIADSYLAHVKAKANEFSDFELVREVTLSVIDLSKIRELTSALDDLSKYLNGYVIDLDTTYSLTKTIRGTERYGEGGSESSGHLDIYDFANQLNTNFPEFRGMPNTIKTLARDSVVYKINGEARPNSHGISMYMQVDEYESNAPYLRYVIGDWINVLENNRARLDEDSTSPYVDLSMEENDPHTITGSLTVRDLDSVGLYITQKSETDENKIRIISAQYLEPSDFLDSSDGSVNFVWNEEMISLCNDPDRADAECRTSPMYFDENGATDFAYVPVRVENFDGYNGTLILIYEIVNESNGNKEFLFIGGWPGIDENGNAVRQLMPLVEGAKVYTHMIEVDDQDPDYYNKIENDPITVTENFGPAYHRYEGTYNLYVEGCDFSGNCMFSQPFEFKVQ